MVIGHAHQRQQPAGGRGHGGCRPSTITRAAARDRQFARQLIEAEHNVEVEALRRVREASKDPRHWRAAAWMLERRNPDDFGPRPPKMFSQVAVAALLSNVCQMLTGTVPEENCLRPEGHLDRLMLDLRSEMATRPISLHRPDPRDTKPPGPLAAADDLQDAGDDEAGGDATDGECSVSPR